MNNLLLRFLSTVLVTSASGSILLTVKSVPKYLVQNLIKKNAPSLVAATTGKSCFKRRLLKQSSYVDFCYSSAPKETAIAPATLECRKVASHEKQSCGYGLSRSACLENTGCCWHVDDQADTYCYKTRIITVLTFSNMS